MSDERVALTPWDVEIQFVSLPIDPHILIDNLSPSPTSGWILRSLGGLVIATSLGLCIGADVKRVFFARWPARLNQQCQQWDALFRSRTPPRRGVFLKFIGFPKGAGGFTSKVYFRAVYVLYPRPVLVAQPRVVVNNTTQLLQGNSVPDERSLRDRGVGSIVDLELVGMQPVIRRVKWLTE